MKKNDLDRALGPTPPVFTDRVANTLLIIKEEPELPRKSIRRTLVIAIALLFVVGAAIALVVTQGQDWYYHNRFTAYQENEPEKQEAILTHLSTDIPQEQSESGLVTVAVQDASWVPEDGIATLSFAAQAQKPDADELHSILDLDEDGCWADTLDPDDPDSRTEHWLWTDKGYGLPADVMDDPTKRLLLFDDGCGDVYIGADGEEQLPLSCTDPFQAENGGVICVLEFDLTRLDPEAIQAQSDAAVFDPDWGISEADWQADQAESLHSALQYAQAANAAIAANTDENGMLTLRYEYAAVPFGDGAPLTGEAVPGQIVFQINVR